jgi:hypothetical protein
MGMDAKGMDMATYFFRDKIYSDKIMAVVREYVCNAIDEHKKFGIDKAVEYGIKDGKFFVRDFANGLDEDGVRKIFGMYFRSTKSDTNESIGGFGVGSKAGHCYSDTFNVTSYHNGTKTIYSAVLGGGENGVPVGTIYNLHSEPTTEQGIEIDVEIKETDGVQFADKCVRFHNQSSSNISLSLWGKFSYAPNEIVDTFEKDGIEIKIVKTDDKSDKHIIQDYRNPYHTSGFAIKMGDVSYSNSREENIKAPLNNSDQSYRVLVECPIGSLDIPVSRENLDETKRNDRMVEKVEKVIGDYVRNRYSEYAKMTPDKFYLSQIEYNKTKTDWVSNLKNSGGWLNDDRIIKGCQVRLDYLFGYFMSETIRSIAAYSKSLHNKPELCPETKKKPILVVIPSNNRTAPHWTQKVKWFEDLTDKQYFILHFSQWSHTSKQLRDDPKFMQELEKYFVVTEAKKLKYPKRPKQGGAAKSIKGFVVWKNGYKLKDLYNPIQYHNMIMREYNSLMKTNYAEVKTVEEAKKQIAKIKKNFHKYDNNHQSYTYITLQKTRSRYGNCQFFVSAKSLRDGLLDMGYMLEHDKEYSLINSKFEENKNQEYVVYDLASKYYHSGACPDHIKKMLETNHKSYPQGSFQRNKHTARLGKRIERILEQPTFGAKMFAHILSGIGFSRSQALTNHKCNVTRKELRNLLTESN